MIIIKTPQELQLMRESNRLVAEALQELKKLVVADITTEDLDRFAEDFIRRRGAQPAFKGYRGYPASLCVSVNEEIVHGIPSKKKLRDGDIVSLDLGVLMNGFYGDAAITVPVGSEFSETLIMPGDGPYTFYAAVVSYRHLVRSEDVMIRPPEGRDCSRGSRAALRVHLADDRGRSLDGRVVLRQGAAEIRRLTWDEAARKCVAVYEEQMTTLRN